ncbi:MAG: acetyl-CoA carboxylase biotin carboxyl carrier protein [candidate division WOR-3 bacterium]
MPVKIVDTTLRDGHQSLWATRMATKEMMPILEKLDQIGYYSLEVWGGATFDVAIRYLNDDPWERLSLIREKVKKTRLQMLLRGQNIVGYRNYPDDLLEAFIDKAAERGIDIFRIFDALNDIRNLKKAIEFVKKRNKHAQGTICYTISPVHTIEYYVALAKEEVNLGVDSICIKDMAGIISPSVAYELIRALKSEISCPINLHSHSSSGMVVASYLKALEAGVDIIDTAHFPLSFATSQPPIETILAILEDTPHYPELDRKMINEVSQYLEDLRKRKGIVYEKMVDDAVLTHQIPGGMMSNLISQLKEMKAEDRLPEVLAEVPKVRRDLGYPPLVTPTSQIVGVQAVFNVTTGVRYKVVPKEVRDYVKGLYGRPPAPIKEPILKKILGDERPIDKRPADLLEPILPKVKEELNKDLVEKEEDYLTYALFPEIALKFFEARKNPKKEEEEVKEEKGDKDRIELLKKVFELAEKFNINSLEWQYEGNVIRITRGQTLPPRPQEVSPITPPKIEEKITSPPPKETEKISSPLVKEEKVAPTQYEEIKSPMVGTFYSRTKPDAPPFVKEGDIVEPGQVLCLIEAMKLMNEIEAEKRGKIIKVLAKDGQPVEFGQTLFLFEPL